MDKVKTKQNETISMLLVNTGIVMVPTLSSLAAPATTNGAVMDDKVGIMTISVFILTS